MFDTIEKFFHYQIDQRGNDTLTFYIGLKRINQAKQWEGNVSPFVFSLEMTIFEWNKGHSIQYVIVWYKC